MTTTTITLPPSEALVEDGASSMNLDLDWFIEVFLCCRITGLGAGKSEISPSMSTLSENRADLNNIDLII